MANLLNTLIDVKTKVFDIQRDLFFPAGSTLELLEMNPTENLFDVVHTVESGWFIKFNEFRNEFKVEIAADSTFSEVMDRASHLRVNGEVYTATNADRVPPMGTDPTWKLFCTRFQGKARFRAA